MGSFGGVGLRGWYVVAGAAFWGGGGSRLHTHIQIQTHHDPPVAHIQNHQAVKAGGPDPEVNRALFQLIKEAKAQGVPNDNIQRAIQRGSSADDADYKEAVYEVSGDLGVGW